MSNSELYRLVGELRATLHPYIDHAVGCTFGQSNPDGDYCTCGLRAAVKKANDIADRMRAMSQCNCYPWDGIHAVDCPANMKGHAK